MRVYLAGPWSRRKDVAEAAQLITDSGHEITHPWWTFEDDEREWGNPEVMRARATADLHGVTACERMVLLNYARSEGKAVEQGIAIARGIPIIAVGNPSTDESRNVFHWMPKYVWVPTLELAVELLNATAQAYSLLGGGAPVEGEWR